MVFSDLKKRLKTALALAVRPSLHVTPTKEPNTVQLTTDVGTKNKKPKITLKVKLPWIKRKATTQEEYHPKALLEAQSASIVIAPLEDGVMELTESVRQIEDSVSAIHYHRRQRFQTSFQYLDPTDTTTDALSDSSILVQEYPYRLHYGPHVENIENNYDLEFDNEVTRILSHRSDNHSSFESERDLFYDGMYRSKTRRGRTEDDDWASQLTPSTPRSSSPSLISPLILPSVIPAERGPLNETHHISYIPAHCKTVGGLALETAHSPTAPHSLRSSTSLSFSVKSPVLSTQRFSGKVFPSTLEPNAQQKGHPLFTRIESMSSRRKMLAIMDRIRRLELIRTELQQNSQLEREDSDQQRWHSVQRLHMGRHHWSNGYDHVQAKRNLVIKRQPCKRHDIRSPFIYRHTPSVTTFQDWVEAHRGESGQDL
ncbi:hypothetical protein EMPS_08842 [Entomortierella parvispora]|uniref:Uncharacterized protein n=1 Tax=Entomortierella parvispora TaxID=205924 RepID=A0A9P3HH53_9FUNG|nr:hypothetical protein EMPS_08842 [Entomortierella parvispora]